MENNLSAAAKAFTRPSPLKSLAFSVIASLLLFAVNLPVYFVSLSCFIIACVLLTAAMSYKGNLAFAVTVLPSIAYSALFGNIICAVYPLFACLIAISAIYSVKHFKDKKYTVIAAAMVFFMLFIFIAALSMIVSYGSLSSSAFSALNDDAKKIWLDFVNENSAILGEEFVGMGEELYDNAVTLILYFSVGIVLGGSVALGYVFTSIYYFFIKEENGYRYSVKKENAQLNVSTFGASLFFISMLFTTLVMQITSSLTLTLIFVNLSLIYFPLFLVIGMKSVIIRLRAHKMPVFYIVFICITLLISPLYPLIILSLFGASDTITFSIQKKIQKRIRKDGNDGGNENDQQ